MYTISRNTKEFIDQALERWSVDAERSIKGCEDVKNNPLYKAVLENLQGVIHKCDQLRDILDYNIIVLTDEELDEINLYGKKYIKKEEI